MSTNWKDQYYNTVYRLKQLDGDEKGNSFDKIAELWQEPEERLRILDLGCGAGSISSTLVAMGHEVHGLDISQEAVNRAVRKGLKAQVADLDRPLPYPDESFDGALALDILEHLFEPLEALRDIYRVLKPGGFAIILIPMHWDLKQRLLTLAGRGIVNHEGYVYDPDIVAWNYYHIRFFTWKEILKVIDASGFAIEKTIKIPMFEQSFGKLSMLLTRMGVMQWLANVWPALFSGGGEFRLVKPKQG